MAGTVDHVKPVAAGGTNDMGNLRAAHWMCNREKGDRLLSWWERPTG
jgi:5-methylcytosine-specific restriction endonuclease McrA